VRGEMKSRAPMSLLPSPSRTKRTTSCSMDVSDPQPLVGRLRSPHPRCAYAIASSVDKAAPMLSELSQPQCRSRLDTSESEPARCVAASFPLRPTDASHIGGPASRVGARRGSRANALLPNHFRHPSPSYRRHRSGRTSHSDVHENPERLDITRQNPPAILNFGGGVHYCLGAHLARLELTEALRVITQRMPNPRQTGPSPWKGMAGIKGPATLPLEVDIAA
jgi:hypothetical protein